MPRATGPNYQVKYRRRRKNLTDFSRRLELVKSGIPRLVVRKTNRGVIVQLLEFGGIGDKVIASVHSRDLLKFGWQPRRNLPSAYLSGLLCAKKSAAKGGSKFCADIGLQSAKGSLVFAAIKGAIDGGLKSAFSSEALLKKPIDGSPTSKYAAMLKEKSPEKYKRLFSDYLQKGINPESLPVLFAAAKEKILSS
ncbi:hypothetical protein AUJ17_02050 [Candidatus Micrarchaeota archaeon CG1_02_47_40]|nr:MAG: hypothetical protein AUJ17_02050 [Candidatus Micrarchaeota archaeon CG1_02_47_40]